MMIRLKFFRAISALLFTTLLCACAALGGTAQPARPSGHPLVNAFDEARLLKQPFPLVKQFQPSLTTEQAYAVQRHYADRLATRSPLIGYKAGLTSSAGQAKFAVSEPVAATLFADGVTEKTIALGDAYLAMLETELGFVADKKIDKPIATVAELRSMFDKVVPIIEVPDLAYDDLDGLTGIGLIATNVASDRLIIGSEKSLKNLAELNALAVTLTRDGRTINTGSASDAMGDQWQALLWLVNRLVKAGYVIEPGHLLITGALGKMVPAEIGEHQADFGELGTIKFSVEP